MKINQEQKQEYKHLTRSFDQKVENHSSTQAHAYTHTDKQTPNKRCWNKYRERAPSQSSKLNRNWCSNEQRRHFSPTPESYQELLEDQRKPTTRYLNSVCVKRLYASCKKDLKSRWHAQSQGTLIPH